MYLAFPLLIALGFLNHALDPDFGWHLLLGKEMVEKKTLISNYVGYGFFHDLKVGDHQWLSDILLYLGYNKFGYLFLEVFFLFILALTFFLMQRVMIRRKISSSSAQSALILLVLAVLPFYGVRLQVFIWLGVALIFYIHDFYQSRKRRFFWYFLLLMIGGNLHSGFLFLIPVTLFLEAEEGTSIKETIMLNYRHLLLLFFVGLTALSLNPNLLGSWHFILNLSTNRYYETHISEWLPIYFAPPFFPFEQLIPLALIIFCFLMTKFWKKTGAFSLIMIVVYLILGVKSRRNFPLFMLVTLPFFGQAVDSLFKKIVSPGKILRSFSVIASLLLLLLFGTNILRRIDNEHVNLQPSTDKLDSVANGYPIGAAKYLIEHPLEQGNIFNPYNWGGYLVWRVPNLKIFIDGRAPQYLVEEKRSMLEEYDLFFSADDQKVKSQLAKYNIKRVIAEKTLPVKYDPINLFFAQLSFTNDEITKMTNPKNTLLLTVETDDSWQKVYEDNISAIYDKIP